MKKEIIYSLASTYRTSMDVYAYKFGHGKKSACIVGSMRGNEIQQLYICSQLINKLKELESNGSIVSENEITVIPCVNNYSMNIDRKFWVIDNTDINRMFHGDAKGETTKKIASGVFEKVKGYDYGIQLTSFYMPGNFVPHVRMMDTGKQSPSLASLFGMPFVVIRKPQPIDTTTLNYNWQLSGTNAFSLYTNENNEIDEVSARQAVSAILRFLTRMGILKYNNHSGYISTLVEEDELMSIKTKDSGIYRRLKNPGEEVRMGDALGEVVHPYEGDVISQILAPTDGVLFFAHNNPFVTENEVIFKIIRRLHE